MSISDSLFRSFIKKRTPIVPSNLFASRDLSRSNISLVSKENQKELDNISLDSLALPTNSKFNIYNTLERVRKNTSDAISIRTFDEVAKAWMIKAAKNDTLDMIEMLKENPGLVNQKDFISGYTALHWAAKKGNIQLARILVGKYCADVNQKTHGGYTALHLAAQHGHQDLFDQLIEFDADFTIRDNYGRKPHQYKHVLQNQRMGRKPGFRNSQLKVCSFYNQCISKK